MLQWRREVSGELGIKHLCGDEAISDFITLAVDKLVMCQLLSKGSGKNNVTNLPRLHVT